MTKQPQHPGAFPKELTLEPGCKINLFLRILGRREDGMHELQTLFYPLPEPSDHITVRFLEAGDGQGLQFSCSEPDLRGDDNLVVRSYKTFAARSGFVPPLKVYLEKHVPPGSGLGGGSADAAAMLRLLNDLAKKEGRALAAASLAEAAAGLGADVPFFLQHEPALAGGIGELLQPEPTVREMLSGMTLVLCLPRESVSTSWAYSAWDQACETGNLTACEAEDMYTFCLEPLMLYNSFESVVFSEHPALGRIKGSLLCSGAQGALLSGSGSSVFGLFRCKEAAKQAQEALFASGIRALCISC